MSSFTHLFYGEHRRYFEKYFNAFFLSIKWKSLGTKTFFKISSFVFPQNKSQVWNNMRLSKWWQFSILVELEQGTEPPTAPRAPQHKWLPAAPGRCSRCVCVCVFTTVCVHFGWVKCRAQIPSMGHHTWPYVMSLSLTKCYAHRKWVFQGK